LKKTKSLLTGHTIYSYKIDIIDHPTPTSTPPHHFLIISNSLAAFIAFQNSSFLHPMVLRIHALFSSIASSPLKISFCWVLGHCGIRGNEAIKSATTLPQVHPKAFPSSLDLAAFIRQTINQE